LGKPQKLKARAGWIWRRHLRAEPVKVTTGWKTVSADKVRAERSDARFQIVLGSLADGSKSAEALKFEMAAQGGRSGGKAKVAAMCLIQPRAKAKSGAFVWARVFHSGFGA
jgi:hypothetical protein